MDTQKNKTLLLGELYKPYKKCTGCHFNMQAATQIVLGEGNPDSDILLIGEAPGREEDLQGRPFIGRSGKLLTRVIEILGKSRSDVYITNIIKIRPPNNRKPLPQEIEAAKPLLLKQINIIRPKVICTLGSSALEALLGTPVQITKIRGTVLNWHGIPLVPTYHPAYILRNRTKLETFVDDLSYGIKNIS